MQVKIEPSWQLVLQAEFQKLYFKNLVEFVKQSYQIETIFPPPKRIFFAFDACPFNEVKVVILGQDPYHGMGEANGLCFSVNEGVKTPPSLKNIYKEIQNDIGAQASTSTDLTRWAKQGVLLLNATLTVKKDQPGSHQGKGWELFTDAVVQTLSNQKHGLVFILWGAYAQKKGSIIDRNKHHVISSAHPSPFSADKGFFGSKPFSKTNAYLTSQGHAPILW